MKNLLATLCAALLVPMSLMSMSTAADAADKRPVSTRPYYAPVHQIVVDDRKYDITTNRIGYNAVDISKVTYTVADGIAGPFFTVKVEFNSGGLTADQRSRTKFRAAGKRYLLVTRDGDATLYHLTGHGRTVVESGASAKVSPNEYTTRFSGKVLRSAYTMEDLTTKMASGKGKNRSFDTTNTVGPLDMF